MLWNPMEQAMSRKLRLFFVVCFTAAFIPLPPASAHIGDHPHVPEPTFKSTNDVAVQIGAAVSDEWRVIAVVNNLDSRLGPPPDLHYANCAAHPAWGCIKVHQINTTQQDPYVRPVWSNSEDWGTITLNVAGDWSPEQAGTCNGLLAVFGVHNHRENIGCRRQGYSTADKLPSEHEMDALRNAYRRN